MPIVTTTTFLRKDNKILLATKKRGFGVGKIMGVGGKQEGDERIEETAIREVEEEIGVRITKIERMATVIFDDLYYRDKPERVPMYVFVATEWDGEPKESDEVKPEWYALPDIPYNKMWEDAQVYLPRVIRGEKFEAYFRYNEKDECIEQWTREIPEKILACLSDAQLGMPEHTPIDEPFYYRFTARGILIDNSGRVGLMQMSDKFCVTPGGGIDEGEFVEEALRRELVEEAGYEVAIIAPLGRVIEERHWGNMHGVDFYYLCRAKKAVANHLTDGEAQKELKLVWFKDFNAAIKALDKKESVFIREHKLPFFVARDIAAMHEAERVLKMRKLGHGSLGGQHG